MMNREELISKWLDNALTDQELKAFKALEDYDDLIKLNTHLQHFKATDYDTSEALDTVLTTIRKEKTTPKIHWLKPFLRIAAVLAISCSVYFYMTTLETQITTAVAQKTTVTLPDASTVALNANSSLAYNKQRWDKTRDVTLKGEAFFKVAKGATFNVITNLGQVTVYGTEFNVKQREHAFEVICYEGLVGVTYNAKEVKLKPGERFLVHNGKLQAKDKEYRSAPSWIHNESEFKSSPFKQVIATFEQHYGVTIVLNTVDTSQLFTGSFTHDDIEVALQSITLPLQLKYTIQNNTITLTSD